MQSSLEENDEAEIVRLLEGHDYKSNAEAMRRLYNPEWKALAWRAINQVNGQPDDVHDIFHKGLLRLWKSAQTKALPEGEQLKSHFYKSCFEIAAKKYKPRKRFFPSLKIATTGKESEAGAALDEAKEKKIKAEIKRLFEQLEIIDKLKSQNRKDNNEGAKLLYTSEYMAFAYKLGRKFNKSEEEIEDVFQDSLHALWQKFYEEDLELEYKLKTYLNSIIANKYKDKYRLEKREEELMADILLLLDEFVEVDYDSSDEKQIEQKRKRLAALFKALGETCATILKLHTWGHEYEEISGLVGHKNGDVTKAQAYRCREKLRALQRSGM
jgi:RNA polymerase sigma factor (sigma-70 family)